jgi:predicted nucleotidyltransferase
MDLGDPTRAVTPTLDGAVLAVLAQAGRPLTVGEVAAQSVRGSEIGIRRCLGRLVDQGIVRATEMGRNRVHELNREHLAAPAAQLLADLRRELWKRLRREIRNWSVAPYHACVFGSAARGDGGDESDVDLLLVHPLFPGDPDIPRQATVLRTMAVKLSAPLSWSEKDATRWIGQVDRLRERVLSWTGNRLQVVDVSYAEWIGRPLGEGLWAEIDRDGIDITPSRLASNVPPAGDG